MKCFFIGVLLICSTAVNAEALFPPAFNAVFELYKKGLGIAETKYQLRHQSQVHFTSNTHLIGFASLFSNDTVIEESVFDVTTPAAIKLKHYQFEQTGEKSKSIVSAIDWQQQKITTTINKQAAITSTFKQTLWNKHSVLLALMTHANDEKKTLVFNALDKGIVKQYSFRFIGTKEIELDDDEWKKTAVWQRENSHKKTIFYLDPTEHHIPLKIEEYRNQQLRATLWLTELNWYE
jgi:Protein of unknown function (DUF3108)